MIQFFMRCNRSIEGEQQVNDQTGKLVTNETREVTLISTAEDGKPFDEHVQYATFSATMLFPAGFDSAEYERVRRGRNVRVTVEVLDEPVHAPQDPATEVAGVNPVPAGATPPSGS